MTAGTFTPTLSQNKGTHMLGVGATGVTIKNLIVDSGLVQTDRQPGVIELPLTDLHPVPVLRHGDGRLLIIHPDLVVLG